jgi:hypothetical protein
VALPSNTSPSLQFSTIAERSIVADWLDSRFEDLHRQRFDTRILLTVGYFVRF